MSKPVRPFTPNGKKRGLNHVPKAFSKQTRQSVRKSVDLAVLGTLHTDWDMMLDGRIRIDNVETTCKSGDEGTAGLKKENTCARWRVRKGHD